MNCYETIYILHPDLSEEAEAAARDAVADIIEKAEGRIYQAENWGKKRLAYEIRKQTKGTYRLIRFIGNAESVAAMERMFRLDEAYLKYLILRLNDDPANVGELQPEPSDEVVEGPSEALAAPARDRD